MSYMTDKNFITHNFDPTLQPCQEVIQSGIIIERHICHLDLGQGPSNFLTLKLVMNFENRSDLQV